MLRTPCPARDLRHEHLRRCRRQACEEPVSHIRVKIKSKIKPAANEDSDYEK
jgi:hypothetical protein